MKPLIEERLQILKGLGGYVQDKEESWWRNLRGKDGAPFQNLENKWKLREEVRV